jgi:P-type Mg2+ transporter
VIILGIVLASGVLGFWQERGAAHAVDKLLAVVQTKATALRDGVQKEIPVAEVVPGDIVVLSAGKSIPGDCLVLESKDLFLDEAALTGETFPVEKTPETVAPDTPLGKRANTLFMGTHVVSGSAAAAVVRTGGRRPSSARWPNDRGSAPRKRNVNVESVASGTSSWRLRWCS